MPPLHRLATHWRKFVLELRSLQWWLVIPVWRRILADKNCNTEASFARRLHVSHLLLLLLWRLNKKLFSVVITATNSTGCGHDGWTRPYARTYASGTETRRHDRLHSWVHQAVSCQTCKRFQNVTWTRPDPRVSILFSFHAWLLPQCLYPCCTAIPGGSVASESMLSFSSRSCLVVLVCCTFAAWHCCCWDFWFKIVFVLTLLQTNISRQHKNEWNAPVMTFVIPVWNGVDNRETLRLEQDNWHFADNFSREIF